MSTLRTAAQQALTILEAWKHKGMWGDWDGVTDTLRAALAEPVECPHGVTDGNCKECYEQSTTPRKPLTEEEIRTICKKAREDAEAGWSYVPYYMLLAIRGVEQAHGIGGSDVL